MVSAVAGWPLDRVDQYIAKRDGPLVMRAGAAADIFSMCPDRALELFEIAAQMGEPIAAYNAALMHLDNGSADRTRAAKALLSQATKSGDQKAAERLRALESSQRPQ
jgi:TPR repeat protein